MKFLYVLIALLFIGVSCSNKKKNDIIRKESVVHANDIIKIKINNEYNNIIQYDSIFKNINIIPLETTKECLIQEIKKIKINNNLIYIQNNNSNILVFNFNGRFVRSIGIKGRGPGEIMSLRDFDIDNNYIFILDFQSIKKYTLEGTYIEDYNLDFFTPNDIITCNPLQFAVNKNIIHLWGGTYSIKNNNKKNLFALYVLNDSLNVKYRYFPLKHMLSNSLNRFSKFSDNLIISPPFGSDTIYEKSNKKMTAKYFVDFGEKRLTEKIPEIFNSLENTMPNFDARYSHSIENVFEIENWLFFRFKHNRYTYNVYYNKEDKESYVSSFYPRPKYRFSPFTIDGVFNNTFIAVVPPSILREDGNEMDKSIRRKYITDSVFFRVNETDNPILYFCDMK